MRIYKAIKKILGIQDDSFFLLDFKVYQGLNKIVLVFDRKPQLDEYDRRNSLVRAPNWGKLAVYIQFPKIRYIAPNGIVRNEQLPWLGYYQRLTREFEYQIATLCQIATPYQVSLMLGLNKSTVYRIEKLYLEKGLSSLELPKDLSEISIDEVSWRKGHRYFTLVTNIKTHRVIWAALGRTSEAIDSFFHALGPDRCRAITTVAIDMCDTYEGSVRRYCPHANIVYDRFHVIKMLNEAINEVRREEFDKAAWKGKKLLLNSKWILLKRESKLSSKEKNHLDRLCDHNKNIQKAVLLKELFSHTYQYTNPTDAQNHLIECIVSAYQSGLQPLKDFAEFINRRKEGIMNWYLKKRSTSVSEGINHVVKTLRRTAYGYRDPYYFRLKILQKCGYLEISPI